MAGKYAPLENYLRDLPDNQREVTLRFEEIEKILKSKLGGSCRLPPDGDLKPPRAVPSSAHEDRRWWDHETEGNHVNGRAWANAGWKVESLDILNKWVILVRVR
jgi:hypothetical protein